MSSVDKTPANVSKGERSAKLIAKVDGLCEPAHDGQLGNPGGVATYGFFICDEDGRPFAKGSGVIGEGKETDHLVAEYEAVLHALRYLLAKKVTTEPVEVQNDNQQLVLEMKGEKKVGTGSYQSKYDEAKKLTSHFASIRFKRIDGALNWEADCLAWKEYRRYLSEKRSIIWVAIRFD